MEQDIKKEARRQYFKYFRIWFIITGILLVLGTIILVGKVAGQQNSARGNDEAPEERVYDYADVLTDEEEESLRAYIAKKEEEAQIDLVLVTICEDVEAEGSWERTMMAYADDFYDYNKFGYNKVHGDGALLLDNWYEGQGGSWLSTCGSVYDRFGDYEIDEVLDAVYYEVEDDPYQAYKLYVDMVADYMNSGGAVFGLFALGGFFISAVVALIYACVNLYQKKASVTTNSSTYVVGGKPVINEKRDDFIRKNVVKRRIETSSSSGGSSGGGGGHRSSSGVSHGGGGRRR